MEVDYLAREGDLCFVYILDGGGEGRWALCVADVLTGEPVYDFFQGNRIYYEGVSTKKVAAGTFANCKSFYYLYVSEGVTSWLTECFAPRVGLIYAEYGDDLGPEFWTYELKSYEVKYSSLH